MLSAALSLSWMVVGVLRMALHTQPSYCFGNLPMERGLVITWFTPTSFHPSEHWIILDRAHERRKYSSLFLSDFGSGFCIIHVGKSGLETFCSHCFVSIGNRVSSLLLVLSLG